MNQIPNDGLASIGLRHIHVLTDYPSTHPEKILAGEYQRVDLFNL
ncbi:MAG: hypothetical protein WA112_09290 [Rugosibacter sp.]|jgi:hypothetical protein